MRSKEKGEKKGWFGLVRGIFISVLFFLVFFLRIVD